MIVARVELVWNTVDTAPSGKIVLTAGGGGQRFMQMDENGQWRNMMGRPKNAPQFWADVPRPPTQSDSF